MATGEAAAASCARDAAADRAGGVVELRERSKGHRTKGAAAVGCSWSRMRDVLGTDGRDALRAWHLRTARSVVPALEAARVALPDVVLRTTTRRSWISHSDVTTPARFLWTDTLRALCSPAPPPPGLVRAGTVLLALCLTAVLVLIGLGYVWHDNTHRYFGELKAGTYLYSSTSGHWGRVRLHRAVPGHGALRSILVDRRLRLRLARPRRPLHSSRTN